MVGERTANPIRLAIPLTVDDYAWKIRPRGESILRSFATWAPSSAPRPLAEPELASQVANVEGLIVSWEPVTRWVLDAAGSLRIVGKLGGAVGHVDLETCFARGIVVVNAPEDYAPAVAEFTLGMVLSGLRNLPWLESRLHRDGAWEGGVGEELAGKSVGIVGLGAIGRRFVQLLAPFGCDVLIHSAHASPAEAAALGARLASLDEVCRCQIVSLHGALTTATRGLIGPRELALLPDGALLVNTARAAIVDESALLAELRGGRIRAALDVYPAEPLPVESPLRALANVLLFPHRAAATREAYARLGATIAEDFRLFFAGEEPINRITPGKLARMTAR